MINLHLGDGEKALKEMDENQYGLAIIDPPYGIGEANEKQMRSRHHSQYKYKGGWDKTAIIKIAETLNLNPHLAASTQFASCHGWNATRKD